MITVISLGAGIVALVVAGHGLWWTFLSLVAMPSPRTRAPAPRASAARLSVLVPAHNESALIADCVRSLQAASRGRHTVLVVADNCTDDTAAIARALGAEVVERLDPLERGKSFALDAGLLHLARAGSPPQAVVFVDADTVVTPNLLDVLAEDLGRGDGAVQVYYEAAPGEAALTRLRALAFRLIHWSRALGSSRLGIGAGLKGNGMMLTWDLVRDGFRGQGLTEDAALTLDLAARGVAVAFEPRARVTGFMASTYRDARVQDERWERGRLSLTRAALLTAARSLLRGRPGLAAASFDIASLPLSLLALGAALSLLSAALGGLPWPLAVLPAASLACYVATGLAAARTSPSELRAFAAVPRFLLHKIGVYARMLRGGAPAWQRTGRGD